MLISRIHSLYILQHCSGINVIPLCKGISYPYSCLRTMSCFLLDEGEKKVVFSFKAKWMKTVNSFGHVYLS